MTEFLPSTSRAGGVVVRRRPVSATVIIAIALAMAGMVALLLLHRRGAPRRLTMLRSAILGVDKRSVAAALGPPRTSAHQAELVPNDTWYYAIDPRRRLALAI